MCQHIHCRRTPTMTMTKSRWSLFACFVRYATPAPAPPLLHPPSQPGHQADAFDAERPSQLAGIVSKWRQKERLKTTAVSLVLCLNIGVDPPDVIRISPCARLECWVDPLSMQPPKALETVGTWSTWSTIAVLTTMVNNLACWHIFAAL